MPRISETQHVRKICGCMMWKKCEHPWYVSYRFGSEYGPDGKSRERGLRAKLAPLVGREPRNFEDARKAAREAITRWLDEQILPFELAKQKLRRTR